jgi:cytochrome c oxidase subunit IV
MEDSNQPYKYAVHHGEEAGKKIRKRIWLVFWILLAVTTVEVSLGLVWKSMGLPWDVIKLTFIVLTLVKAFYIVVDYMHLGHERKSLKLTILGPYTLFIVYLLILVLVEAYAIYKLDHL